ncbi:YncE family protein [Persicimonas caeni]|uniref:YncE family protein n=1 Tax=Persicimonas caeni TaxID=2292766 RepID=UPI00164D91E7|nr:hypothetical protein [Persicimonas caeni]
MHNPGLPSVARGYRGRATLRAARSLCSLVVVVALCLVGCGEPDEAGGPTRSYEAAGPVCEAGPSAPRATVWADFQTLGADPNAIARGDGYLWVVESSDNTVSRFDPATGAFDAFFIDLGVNRNPYDLYVDAPRDLAYIANQGANTLTVASTQTGEVVAEIGAGTEAFDAPQGVTASDDYIYVTNTHLRGRGFDEGSVTVLDRDTREVLGSIPTAKKNPQYIAAIDTPHGPRIAVVSSGAIHYSGTVTSDGALELWTETDDPTAPERQIFALERTDDERMGAPGRPLVTPDATRLYLASATAPVLFVFDLQAMQWLHDTSDPLEVYATDDKSLHNATIDARGVIYLTAFNDDALYLFDTSCDAVLAGPLDLGTTDGYLEGPVDLQVVGDEVYFVMTLSNVMGRVGLGW